MNHQTHAKLGMLAGALFALSISPSLLADTSIEAVNDGSGITAYAHSSKDVLSMTIRVIGPDGFVFENRVEDSVIDWVPQQELSDGYYTWETRTVTLEPGAPVVESALMSSTQKALDSQGALNQEGTNEAAGRDNQDPAEDVPIERFFHSADKQVIRESGRFKVEDGWIVPLDDDESLSATTQQQPGALQRVATAILDFVIPSAHAVQVFNEDVEINTSTPNLYFNSGAGADNEWDLWVGSSTGDFYIQNEANLLTPFRIENGAANDTMRIAAGSTPLVGFGTTVPTEAIHIAENLPRIRLEDVDDAQTWYIKNDNEGQFQIAESIGGTNPFTIAPNTGADALMINELGVGVGGINAFADLSVYDVSAGGRIQILGGSVWHLITDSNGFSIRDFNLFGSSYTPFKVSNTAPTDSLTIQEDGAIGMGTATPDFPLTVTRSDGTAQVRVIDTGGSNGQTMFSVENTGHPRFRLRNSTLNSNWDFRTAGSGSNEQFQITNFSDGVSSFLFRLMKNGDLEVEGDVTANGVVLTSTREAKTDFAPLDNRDVLEKLSDLEISQWRYKHEDEETVHIGPIAEEFHEIFGLSDGKTLNMIDTNGIAFAAIQALNQQNQELRTQNDALMSRLERLEEIVGQ